VAHQVDDWQARDEVEMRSYRIVEVISNLHKNYVVHLYEAGIEEEKQLVFESRDRAEEAALHYVTEYSGYLPFDDE
jgi:hypothetical protein